MKKHIWICDCYLIENDRMVSEYLVIATNKKEARRIIMCDYDHVVRDITSYEKRIIENKNWNNLSLEEVNDLHNNKPVCLIAGT